MAESNRRVSARAARRKLGRALNVLHERAWTTGRVLRLHRITAVQVWVAALISSLLAWGAWQTCGFAGCPNVSRLVAYQPEGAPVLLDREDREFAVLRPVRREVVSLADLPPYVAGAFIAVEDRRFRRHDGVDWARVAAVALRNLIARDVEAGASTITMQLARNVFPERLPATERTMRRKLLEARVAYDIEDRFSKDEILELYLNHIYFGGGAYGVEAAARYYFGKSASELTWSQSALLAALVKAPSNYDPRRHAERAKARRDLVLTLMAAQTVLTAEEAERARNARLAVIEQPPFRGREQDLAAYFVEEIRRVLEDRLGEELYSSRLRIHTTLDVNAQRAAEEELARQLRLIEQGQYGRFNGPAFSTTGDELAAGSPFLQGAVVMLEARTGDVLALVGGRDHRASSYNRALRSRRQMGSAFKPFVFATALAQGYPPSQLIADEPVRFHMTGGQTWEPENYDRGYDGLMTLRQALVFSRNVPTVRLSAVVGEKAIAQTAHAAGLLSDIPETPAMALGAASVTPLELTAAYATFANLGDAVQPRMIRWVEGADGSVLWQEPVQAKQTLEPAVAYLLTDVLRGVVDYGTGAAVRSAGFRGVAAGKTGTTNDGRDVWFVGYTPDIVATVWIGFDQPKSVLVNASGGRIAAPAWGRMMRRVYRERPAPDNWSAPATITARRIDPSTGQVLAEQCWPRFGEPDRELFIRPLTPAAVCPRVGNSRGWFGSILEAIGLRARGDDGWNRWSGAAYEVRRGDGPVEHVEEVLGAPVLAPSARQQYGGPPSRARVRGD